MFIHQIFEGTARRIIVTYPGRFQPFHKGHYAVFTNLQAKFGSDNVFIITGNKTDSIKSPFNFSDKVRFMHAMGVPDHSIIESDRMYDLPAQFDNLKEQVVFITVVGAPDEKRLNPGNVKKDGSPGYFQRLPDNPNEYVTANQHGYVIVEPEHPEVISIGGQQVDVSHGTPCRELWNQVRDNPQQRAEFIKQLYGRNDPELGIVLDKIPTGAPEPAPSKSPRMTKAEKTPAGPKLKSVKVPKQVNEEELEGLAEGIVLTKDDLVDIYIKGYIKNHRDPITKKVGANIPNGMVEKYIDALAEKFNLNPKIFFYAPSQIDEDAAGVGVIASKKQKNDPRYSMSLTKDVRPGQDKKNMKALDLIKEQYDSEPSPVAQAITRRIMVSRTDLLKHGPQAVMAAIDDVADWVGDVDEIGSSDVSGWVAQVERMLKENPPEAFGVGEVDESQVERVHGGPYDRGDADAYYGRRFNPHKMVDNGRGNGGKVAEPLTDPEEIAQYKAGYESGDSGTKDWGESVEHKDRAVTESSEKQKHVVSVTVSDPNSTMVTQRKELRNRRCTVSAVDADQAINTAIAWYRKQGYKVHDHHYVGVKEQEAQLNELSPKTLGNYVKSAAMDAKFRGYNAGAADWGGSEADKHPSQKTWPGSKDDDKAHKRIKGIRTAVNKMVDKSMNERVQQGVAEATGDPKFDRMMGKLTDPKNVKDNVPHHDYSNKLQSITPQQRVNKAAHAVTQRDIIENDEHVIGMLLDKLIGGRVGRHPYDQHSWDFNGEEFETPAGNYYNQHSNQDSAEFYYVDSHHKPQSFSMAYSSNAGGFDLGEIYNPTDRDIPELAKEFGHEHPEFKPHAQGPIDDLGEQGVAEATGDKPFDKMMTTIKQGTNKQKTADRKEQQKQTQQRARDAFGNMFGGGNPADKLKIREQGVAEAFQNDESNLFYRYDTADGRLKQKMIDNLDEREAKSQGYRETPEQALRAHNIMRSKFDANKWIQKQGGKWVQVFPYGKPTGMNENAELLSIGDPVIITGNVEFGGKTGDIDSFGEGKRFVVVNLYNHGKHSFHSSDVAYNEYADREHEDDMDESLYQYNKEDPMNSEYAPDVGMGRMTLRGWKQSLARRVSELARELESNSKDGSIDKDYLWDRVYKKMQAMNLDPIAQEIELAHQELETMRKRGGIRSRAFQQYAK